MKPKLKLPTLLLAIALFAIGRWLFAYIERFHFFDGSETITHIIDVHLIPDRSMSSLSDFGKRFFDHRYVKAAAALYKPDIYMRSFYLVDFFFPFAYGFLFLALFAYWRGTNYFRVFRAAVFACVAFDLSENSFFAYYLFHPRGNANVLVAFCTTVKSILFITCALVAIFGFIAAGYRFFKDKNAYKVV
jgi:hypothetical protein